MKIIVLFLTILTNYQVEPAFQALVIGQAAYGIFDAFKNLYEVHGEFSNADAEDVLVAVAGISQSIDELSDHIDEKLDILTETLIRRMRMNNQIDADVQKLTEYISRIDGLYQTLREYEEHPEDFSVIARERAIKVFTSEDTGDVIDTIRKIHGLIIPGRLGGLKYSTMLLLSQETKEFGLDLCDTFSPPQEKIFKFFEIIVTTEVRAFAMIGFGYIMIAQDQNIDTIGDMRRAHRAMLLRIRQYILAMRESVDIADRRIRRCDPFIDHIPNVTYYEFTRFLQVYVIEEKEMQDSELVVCPSSCDSFYIPEGRNVSDPLDSCKGQLSNCESMNAYAKTCSGYGESRRYQWVEDGNYNHNGPQGGCGSSESILYGYWDGGFTYCDICRCVCTEERVDSTSVHFVSLREITSDIDKNMIVVGIAFEMENGILHINIKQGLLGANGTIVEESVNWKVLDDIHFNQNESIESGKFIFEKHEEDGSITPMIEDIDVAVLTRNAKRFYLDALTVPQNYIITGVRFRRVEDASEPWTKPIQLEIRASKVDYTNEGSLKDIESSVWVTPKDMTYKNKERTEYRGEGFDNPAKVKGTKIDTEPNTYIDLDWSSWRLDAGQTVIPLIDALPVFSRPHIGLSGIGLYHKKKKGYGGFLTFVLETFNTVPFLEQALA